MYRKARQTLQAKPVSYTHLDVYKRQVLVVVMSSTERVRHLRQQQRKDRDREEN